MKSLPANTLIYSIPIKSFLSSSYIQHIHIRNTYISFICAKPIRTICRIDCHFFEIFNRNICICTIRMNNTSILSRVRFFIYNQKSILSGSFQPNWPRYITPSFINSIF